MTRNAHDRADSHFGDWTADLAVLTEAIAGGGSVGESVETVIERLHFRLTDLEEGRVHHFRLAAILKKTVSRTFALQAAKTLTQRRAGSFTLDAFLNAPVLGSFTLDAILLKVRAGSATLDAILRRGTSGSFTLDATISSPHSWNFDAVLRRLVTSSFTLDAVIQGPNTFTLNAVLQRGQTGTFTLDAVIGTPTSGFTGQLGTSQSMLGNIELGLE